jgi:iron-sulfur cluster assembly protein
MTDIISPVVMLTDSAASELRAIREREQVAEGRYLRVGVKGGGCSGLSYILEFDEKQAQDEVYEVNGLEVVVDKRHALYLAGIEVDYLNGLNDRGFVFNNPNAKSTCGCGTSFSA